MCKIEMKHEPVTADIDADYAKHVRQKNDLTQRELAELVGVDQSLVSKIENGRTDVSEKVKRAYINKLNSFDSDGMSGVMLPDFFYASLLSDLDYMTDRVEQLASNNAYLRERNAKLRAELKALKDIRSGDWWPMTEAEADEQAASC